MDFEAPLGGTCLEVQGAAGPWPKMAELLGPNWDRHRPPNKDPGSYCKDVYKKDAQFIETSR